MIVADVFIYLVYMFFGIFQYSYQGQYTFSSAIQSITPFNYRTAGNVLAIMGKFTRTLALRLKRYVKCKY